jgi:STE24 endopeptidase
MNAMVAVPEATAQAMAYYHAGIVLWIVGGILGLLVPAVILFTGWSAKMRDVACASSTRWPVQVLVYLVLFVFASFIATLPLAFYADYVVEHQFGLSNQSFAKWLIDALIGMAAAIVIGFLVMLALYGLLRASPRRWWLWLGSLSIPFVVFMVLVQPIWVDPLFNRIGPMKDPALEAKILALAARAGIERGRVFEVAKSEDTKKTNAYVNGILGTQRIVLWDTLIEKLDEREILSTVGHEMGHYVLGHMWQGMILTCALFFLAFYGAHRLSGILLRRYSARFGFYRLDDIASLPLLMLVAGAILTVVAPAVNAFSRHVEHEADRFELELVRDNRASATGLVKMTRDDLGVPRPYRWVSMLRDHHPAVADRIEFANTYRPWEKGEPLRYGDRIRKQVAGP